MSVICQLKELKEIMEKLKRVERYIEAHEVYETKIVSGSVVKIRLMNMLDDIGIKDIMEYNYCSVEVHKRKLNEHIKLNK